MPDRKRPDARPQKRSGGETREARPEAGEVRARGERIAKVMARAGLCSRRDAEAWIAAGRVAVNGRVLASPALNVTEQDQIVVDGKPLAAPERTRLFLFNKPAGLVPPERDPDGRRTAFADVAGRFPEPPRLISR